MSIFSGVFLGVKIWIWLYFLFSVFMGLFVSIYFFRERIKKKYYQLRYPEKLIKVVVHYKSGMFKEYWRLIPDDNYVKVEGKTYNFVDKNLTKNLDTFAKSEIKKGITETTFKVDGNSYLFKDLHLINKRWRAYPEIHYFFNLPNPINFDVTKKKIDLTSKQLEEFKENDLFAKLLTMETEKRMLVILMVLMFVNTIATIVILAKTMGWLEGKTPVT